MSSTRKCPWWSLKSHLNHVQSQHCFCCELLRMWKGRGLSYVLQILLFHRTVWLRWWCPWWLLALVLFCTTLSWSLGRQNDWCWWSPPYLYQQVGFFTYPITALTKHATVIIASLMLYPFPLEQPSGLLAQINFWMYCNNVNVKKQMTSPVSALLWV